MSKASSRRTSGAIELQMQLGQPADRRALLVRWLAPLAQAELLQAREQLGDRDLRLEPAQRRPEAEVRSLAEREMVDRVGPLRLERAGALAPARLVAPRRLQHHDQVGPL